MKINIQNIIHHCSVYLSALLVLAVFLSAAHAKDVVATNPVQAKLATTDGQVARSTDDPVLKSIGDLHSHVDKTMVKDMGMNKVFGDAASLAARREREDASEEQPIRVRLIEIMLMARLTLAYALAR